MLSSQLMNHLEELGVALLEMCCGGWAFKLQKPRPGPVTLFLLPVDECSSQGLLQDRAWHHIPHNDDNGLAL